MAFFFLNDGSDVIAATIAQPFFAAIVVIVAIIWKAGLSIRNKTYSDDRKNGNMTV